MTETVSEIRTAILNGPDVARGQVYRQGIDLHWEVLRYEVGDQQWLCRRLNDGFERLFPSTIDDSSLVGMTRVSQS